ncbi:MAG: protein kinase [Myxococcaceae bacterium]|nr:protein kinase [Myxococcaceae bacterium]
MATEAPIKLIRLKVQCDDEAQFKRELAGRVSSRVFVPTDAPLPKDTLFALHLKFNDGRIRVKGIAKVVKLVDTPRHGMHVKYVALDPDSIQFPLDFAPFEDSGPVATETLLPSTTGEHPALPPTSAPAAAPTGAAPSGISKPWSGGLRPLDALANYQLLERLGGGGMAEVFAARATMGRGVEKVVALKVVLPEFGPGTQYGGLFLNEAKISASLQHPNLIQVFDFGEAAGRPYLAMEYVRGRDLATVLQVMRVRGIKPSTAFCTHVALEVVKALDYLHQRTDADGRWLHLVHRDVSPGNILLSENGEVKLVDFGVAAAGGESQRQLVAGKFSYMPPEQTDGQDPAPSWDLYAAGVVLYEMLTLEPLFEGTTSETRSAPAKRERIGSPSEKNALVTRGLDSVVLTATNPEVQRRYSRARKMLAQLEAEAQVLGAADIGQSVRSLFEVDLENEKKRLDAAVLQARAKAPARAETTGAFMKMRRKVAGSGAARELSRRPWLARGLVAAALLVTGVGAALGTSAFSRSRELGGHLERFDERMTSGSLSGPGGDTALDHLTAARALAPDDSRVAERSASLGKVFELLAEKALARGDDAEAAVHLQALLLADPSKPGVEAKLKETEARVRGRNKPKPTAQ